MRLAAGVVAFLPFGQLTACKGTTYELADAAPSPQASAEPAPLANVLATPQSVALDAGPSPQAMVRDRSLPGDFPHEATRDSSQKEPARDTKEMAGYALQAILRSGEGPPAPKGPEVNPAAIDAARRKAEARVAIELSQTRARFLLSGAFVVPSGVEIRARSDRYGHLLMWPGERTYRVVEPGALRALLGERRLDVAPLSPATVTTVGEGSRRLNVRTRRIEVATRAARAAFEIGSLRDAGEGGALVCRLLLDLMTAPPSTFMCASDDVPLHAELRWTTQGALTFDVTGIARRFDLPQQDLAAPPPSAALDESPPAIPPGELLLSKSDLAAFRNGPIEVGSIASQDAQPPPPDVGLLVINSGDVLRVVWLDGVPVAWVAPGGREWLTSLPRGRYALQWRTFLGDAWEPPRTIVVPGTSECL